MAVRINLNNTRLMGSPIVAGVEVDARSNVTFHRVVLEVTVTGGGGSGTFKFSSPVSGASTIPIDISSAFRAVADGYTPTATSVNSYPSFSVSITAYDEYMIDGVMYTGQSSTSSQSGAVYIGSYSDFERFGGVGIAKWGRKPTTSPQTAFVGKSLIVPGACGGMWLAPSASTQTVTEGANATYNYYGIAAPPDGHEIRFINTLGVHENIFVSGLPTREVVFTTEKYTISKQETLTQFSRGLAVKKNDHETWTFSSGPLDEAWASWYSHEFLMARWVWLGIGSSWIPCHVLPEETTTLFNRAEGNMIEIQFKLELDINGAPQ